MAEAQKTQAPRRNNDRHNGRNGRKNDRRNNNRRQEREEKQFLVLLKVDDASALKLLLLWVTAKTKLVLV